MVLSYKNEMNVLMVQVPTSHLGAGERVYPLGLSRLSGSLPDHIEKKGLDMNIHPDPWDALDRMLQEHCPEVVALSFRNIDPLAGHQTSYLSSLKTAAMLVRKRVPLARILAGGPGFSMFAMRLMQEIPQIDMGLRGEGEGVFKRLLAPDLSPGDIPGLLWRDGKGDNGAGIVANPMGPRLKMDDLTDMDTVLFSPRDYTKGNAYVAAMGIEGKRGCDLGCGYCLYPFLGGARMRLRDPLFIVNEMEFLNKEFGVSLFHFTDPVVNRPLDHFEAFCREMIKRGLKLGWTGFFREDTLTEHSLFLARKAGLAAIYFSADALTDHGLSWLKKDLTKSDILRASKLTARAGMLTMCHFLLNLPGETRDHVTEARQMLETLLDIHGPAANLGAVIFNHVRLYPGAPMTRKLIQSGQLSDQADLLYPVYHNPEEFAWVLHEFEARCHQAGVFSRLQIKEETP